MAFRKPKIVVLERHGNAGRFHPLLLKMSSSFCVQPRLCGPYRGNEKGRVRDRFLAGRHVHSIEQGNRDFLDFIERIAHRQAHPDCRERTIADSLLEEQQHLLVIPDPLPCTDLVIPVVVDKTAFIRFETNLYSVPPYFIEQTLTMAIDDRTVQILSGAEVVAALTIVWSQTKTGRSPAPR